ncbi:MAG: hypothetical protein ACI97A_001348 [Planctomycetota bacterium]|jgi:hypothetical protein
MAGRIQFHSLRIALLLSAALLSYGCKDAKKEAENTPKIFHAVIMDFSDSPKEMQEQVQAAMELHPRVDSVTWDQGKITCYITVETEGVTARASSAIMTELKKRLPQGADPKSFSYESQVTVRGTSRGTKRGRGRAPN